MAEDAKVLSEDGRVHLVPPLGRLTFCGRPPMAGDAAGEPCVDCVQLAAARDAAQARTSR